MSYSDPTPGANTATWHGETYALSNEQGRQALVKALRTSTADDRSEPIVLNDVVVYRDGWNRNGLGFTPQALKRVSDTAKNDGLLFDHNSQLQLGRVLSSRLVTTDDGEQTIVQSLEYSTQLGLDTLALGVDPEYSIQWQSTADTSIVCSACDVDMFSTSDCSCWPGETSEDGSTVMALWTDATHAETSQTFTPAVPGTGPGQLSTAPFLQRLSDHRSTSGGKNNMDPITTEQAPAMLTEELTTLRSQLATAEDRAGLLEARLERLECERIEKESRDIVRSLRQQGRLVGDEGEMLRSRAKDPILFDQIVGFVKPNPSHTMGQTVGAADGLPTPAVSQSDFYALRDRVAAQLAADPNLDADRVWATERAAMKEGI